MLQLKRQMLKFGDFEYQLSDSKGSVYKIIRVREGKRFRYLSQGFQNDFELDMNRRYDYKDSVDDNIRCVGGQYNTNLGYSGEIMYCVKKGSFFWNNIPYWSTLYQDRYYKVYEVGRKKEGTFYCVYLDDVLVSMIRKDPKVVYNSTQYEFFLEKDVPVELLSVLILFIDLTRYYPNTDNTGTISTSYKVTSQKELKEKYDCAFIPRIKAIEETDE